MDDLTLAIFQESVSLGLLLVVLAGFYRLVNRLITLLEDKAEDCCEHLEELSSNVEKIATRGSNPSSRSSAINNPDNTL